jgi:amidase/6-aminohexanoate-cyclic-dimer hydrolase
MTGFADYENFDGLGLAALVRQKLVSPAELLEAALARIAALNPRLGCVVIRLDDYARAEIAAGLPEGPFTGVPLLVKDLYLQVKGTKLANGSRLFADFVCPIDQTLAERYRAAGFVFAGRTASPEFGLNMASDPALFGPCRNPWDLARSAGGSSGGSGAAVAARIAPIAHATDGGGSTRIPASNNGLVGLKPTRGRNPAGPLVGEGWSGLSAAHVVTRSVRDNAAVLDATHGPAPGDPYFAPPVSGTFLAAAGAPPKRLRIALQTKAPSGIAVDPECRRAAESAAALCAELGHIVEEAAPEYDYDALFDALWVLAGASVANAVEQRLAMVKRPLADDDLEPVSRGALEHGRGDPIWLYPKALATAHWIGRQMAAFFARYDVALSPVTANPALPLGARPRMGETDYARFLADLKPQIPFTPVYNATGCPALSLPLHWTAGGLPVGVQLGAAFGNDALLYSLAGQLEAARPWIGRKPALLG